MTDDDDDDEIWARELVRKVIEAERLGGGFRLYHETAVKEILVRLKEERTDRAR